MDDHHGIDVLGTLPPGATLLSAYGDDDPSFYRSLQPPLWNIASVAARHGIFVPSVFASPTQQPLAVKPEWRPAWLWSHNGKGQTPERLAVLKAQARRFCGTDPNTFLFIFYSGAKPAAREPQLMHGLASTRASVVKICDG